MINFHNISVSVSGVKLLAQNVSIKEANSLSPVFAVGYKGNLRSVPNGSVKNTVNLEYILEPNLDISQKLIDRIRNYDFNSFPTQIIVGGRTGMGYLNNFSLDISPNDAIVASVQYDIFTEMTGELSEQSRNSFYTGSLTGIAHYSTCYTKTTSGIITSSIIKGNYSFAANFQPIYKIGSPYPTQVKFLDGQEQFNFTSEYTGKQITYSGTEFQNIFSDFNTLELHTLSANWGTVTPPIKLYPASGRIISNTVDIQPDNIILQDTSIIKYY